MKGKNKSALILSGLFLAMAACAVILIWGIGENRRFAVSSILQGLDLQGGVSILYEADTPDPSSADMAAANDLLRRRLDARGYTEASVSQEGARQIRVDIPGVGDPEEAVAQIGAMAVLLFVGPDFTVITNDAGIPLTGERVSSARARAQDGQMLVDITFDSIGTQIFYDATRQFLRQPVHILMDDVIISSPVIQSHISGGTAQITGSFTRAEAELLATQINQGSLPFRLEVISRNVVGARLGAGALNTSVIAGIIGFILVLAFMLIVFRSLGIAAAVALIVDAILFLLIISGAGIVLSLPGIAGLILSIGMATDANIVIFERVREEIASGKTLRSALRTGYRRALPAIIDSNITTIIAGVVLFQLGTGPVMGFAQMLIIGILLSMFTSLVVARFVIYCLIEIGIIKPSHVISKKQKAVLEAAGSEGPEPDLHEYPIVQKRKMYFGISGAIIAIGIVVAVINSTSGRGIFNLDVEFSGGTSFQIDIGQSFENSEVEDIVRNVTGESAPQVQAIQGGYEVMIRTTQDDPAIIYAIIDAFTERFELDTDAFTYTNVSPTVSAAMRRSAVIAILVASIGMLLYITFRFRDIRKGISAVFAQLHDVLIVLCVYVILRIPLNYAFIAVLLTTLGYSINATIIIFDRIRENRVRLPRVSNESLINISVTQTLRRTLFSTASSFLAVLVLFIIGVASIRDFTLPIMVGLLFGAYSSVFLSGSAWYMMLKGKKG